MATLLTSAIDILNAYNECLGLENIDTQTSYILKDSEEGLVISNVPHELYEKKLKKYNGTDYLNAVNEKIANLIKKNIDYFQKSNGQNVFNLNKCFENSTIIFDSLKLINESENGIHEGVKIAYGFVSRKIPINTDFNNKIISRDNIFIHDWHVWNYINNFIVDVTLLKNGPVIEIHKKVEWGAADDHVFLTTPENTNYYGIEFENYDEFVKDFRKTFKV